MALHGLDLNLLVTLDALLSERSVSRAALRLNVTQSAVSHALRRLRSQFGDELLISAGQKMILTTQAEKLHRELRKLLPQIEVLSQPSHRFDPEESTYQFKVVGSDPACAFFWGPLTRRLESVAPRASISVSPYSDRTFERFERAEIDFVILRREQRAAAHPSSLLGRDRFACIGWSRNPQLVEPLTEAHYLAMRHVTLGAFDVLSDMLLNSLGYRRNIVATVPAFGFLPDFILGTQYIATIPEILAKRFAERFDLAIWPVPIPLPGIEAYLQWHSIRDKDPAFLWFREQMHQTVADIRTSSSGNVTDRRAISTLRGSRMAAARSDEPAVTSVHDAIRRHR